MTDAAYLLEPSPRDTMREMSRAEMEDYYLRDRCPLCGAPAVDMLRGPLGGLSINVECPPCGARFNVITGIPRGVLYAYFGQVIRNPRMNG